MQPYRLGIAQLSPSLFVLTHKNSYGTFHNSPSISERPMPEPASGIQGRVPTTDSEYQIQWWSPGGLR
jgi:hypothetical protein